MVPNIDEEGEQMHIATSRSERYKQGKFLQKKTSLKSHKEFTPHLKRNVLSILSKSNEGRILTLLPIRYGRMMESPFNFYRGAASVMAADLVNTPSSGIKLQICGDCHLMNFGGFATPERKIVFGINDFDETIVGPWEWDVKRLAASFVIGGRWKGFSEEKNEEAAWHLANSYRRHMSEYAEMSALQVWYSQLDFKDLLKWGDKDTKKFYMKRLKKALGNSAHEKEFAKLAYKKGDLPRIKDDPPLIYHAAPSEQEAFVNRFDTAFLKYLETLSHDRNILLSRYRLQDIAMKVVGVGSVGNWCGIALLMSGGGDPLFLQFKQANSSALEPFVGKCHFKNHGQRVVEGQKLMQSSYDIFLGWTIGEGGRHYYVRQLRDAKVKPVLEIMEADNFFSYAKACGWALAHAHAKAGDASILKGYMGEDEEFEDAIAKFSLAYGNQNEKDYEVLLDAIKKGLIQVQEGV